MKFITGNKTKSFLLQNLSFHTHTNTNSETNTYTNTDTNTYTNTDTNTYTNSETNTYTNTDTKHTQIQKQYNHIHKFRNKHIH